MHIIIQLGMILAAWKWGDWKNWRQYYPSILFLISCDLLYNFLTYDFPLWRFNPTSFDRFLYRNHTLITLGIDLIGFPAIVLIYLSHFPKHRLKQVIYVAAWAFLNTIIEYVSQSIFKGISYYHGWTFLWSIAVNFIFYMTLRVHYKHPLMAWGISAAFIVFFMLYFGVPISKMK